MGKKRAAIGKALGKTKNAVIGRSRRLGLVKPTGRSAAFSSSYQPMEPPKPVSLAKLSFMDKPLPPEDFT